MCGFQEPVSPGFYATNNTEHHHIDASFSGQYQKQKKSE